MGVCYYAEVNGEVEDRQGDGKALARAADKLGKLAEKLGVTPLESFVSPSDFAQYMEEFAEEADEEIDEAKESLAAQEIWHPSAEGLRTVRTLLEYLRANPQFLKNSRDVIEDLEAFEEVLGQANERGLEWRLLITI